MIKIIMNRIFRIIIPCLPEETRYAYIWNRTRTEYEDRISRGTY